RRRRRRRKSCRASRRSGRGRNRWSCCVFSYHSRPLYFSRCRRVEPSAVRPDHHVDPWRFGGPWCPLGPRGYWEEPPGVAYHHPHRRWVLRLYLCGPAEQPKRPRVCESSVKASEGGCPHSPSLVSFPVLRPIVSFGLFCRSRCGLFTPSVIANRCQDLHGL